MATPPAAQHRDLEEKFRQLNRAVADLRAAVARRPKFEVSSGDLTISGGDLVVDGGDFLLLDTDGSTVFRLGPQQYGDRGVSMYREDGTPALEVREQFDGFGQKLRVLDSVGNELLSEFQVGAGLRRPFLPIPTAPSGAPSGWGKYGPERATTSGTFVSLFTGDARRVNPLIRVIIAVKCSDATTAAEVRLVDESNGNVFDAFLLGPDWTGVLAAGSTAWQEQDSVLSSPDVPYEGRYRFEVQARRTAGAGTVTVAVAQIMGG